MDRRPPVRLVPTVATVAGLLTMALAGEASAAEEFAVRSEIAKFPLTASGWMLDLHGVKPKA